MALRVPYRDHHPVADETGVECCSLLQVCKKLRVMNAVRRFDVGIPITFMQYEVLTAEVLLERLQQRYGLERSERSCVREVDLHH